MITLLRIDNVPKRFAFLCLGSLAKVLAAGLLVTALGMAMVVAPTEETMGHVQRILYLHVASAWLGLLGFAVMGACGLAYLIRRNLDWDHWSHAACEIGWLCSSLTLLTGSLWAHAAWGTWWTWEPRLTTMFILWALYSSCLVVRGSVSQPHQSARIAGTLSILGLLDLPLVIMATRWFRGIHPVSPEMEPLMQQTLLLNVVAFTIFFGLLFARRHSQLASECLLIELERTAKPHPAVR
jgi:heme exporter protein C